MMTEIVYCPPNVDCPCYARLVADNERLRAALERINVGEGWAALIARSALTAQPAEGEK
jgi:hypothetical protein